jgi:hypothetical protein
VTVAAIHQPQYLPYLGFFDKVAKSDLFVVLDDVQFHRRGLQHRNKIKAPKGWQWLTVPVLQRDGQLISEVRINPTEPWQRKHANAIRWNYGRAQHFDRYAQSLIDLLSQPWDRLGELNMALMRWVMAEMGIERTIVRSSELAVDGQRSERLVNLCRAVGATTYLSGPGGRRYMDLDVFRTCGVDVKWQEFTVPTYAQVVPEVGFIADLSIVDVLLCCGPNAAAFLETA